jgi:hypothetical protein
MLYNILKHISYFYTQINKIKSISYYKDLWYSFGQKSVDRDLHQKCSVMCFNEVETHDHFFFLSFGNERYEILFLLGLTGFLLGEVWMRWKTLLPCRVSFLFLSPEHEAINIKISWVLNDWRILLKSFICNLLRAPFILI